MIIRFLLLVQVWFMGCTIELVLSTCFISFSFSLSFIIENFNRILFQLQFLLTTVLFHDHLILNQKFLLLVLVLKDLSHFFLIESSLKPCVEIGTYWMRLGFSGLKKFRILIKWVFFDISSKLFRFQVFIQKQIQVLHFQLLFAFYRVTI
jgi:hypothetical protein